MIPDIFWLTLGFPFRTTRIFSTWSEVSEASSLTKTHKRLFTKKPVVHRPYLGVPRPHRYGLRIWIHLRSGQTPQMIAQVADRLEHSWRAHGVRIEAIKPGRILVSIIFRDPLKKVIVPAKPDALLRPTLGRLETGRLWRMNFKTIPHWLITGATQSGKSNLINTVISKLAPQPIALAGFDLKGGMEFSPYKPRLSTLATTRDEVVGVLDDVVKMLFFRMNMCTNHEASSIWKLPKDIRPIPLVLLIDEVAELFLTADPTGDKDALIQTAQQLIRIAQLGRALGIYLVVSGQRVGSDLGKGVTALRAQLSGRICFRVNDTETAKMTLGDLSSEAVDAAQMILPSTPGVAITASDSGLWLRARSMFTTTENAKAIAQQYAFMTIPWNQLLTV